MMEIFAQIVLLTSALPILAAWGALRRTSLSHALAWTATAWAAWVVLAFSAAHLDGASLLGMRYLSLAMIGCAGVAVLGARRPGVAAWNFVVLGLLAVLLLSWAEGMLLGSAVQLGEVRAVFLAATLATAVLNYLPTRLAPAALLLGVGCGLEMWALLEPAAAKRTLGAHPWPAFLLVGSAPWAAWAAVNTRREAVAAADRLWLHFRESYGLVWSQRVREQFNNAARHAGLPVELHWRGLIPTTASPSAETDAASLQTLTALLKRFGAAAGE